MPITSALSERNVGSDTFKASGGFRAFVELSSSLHLCATLKELLGFVNNYIKNCSFFVSYVLYIQKLFKILNVKTGNALVADIQYTKVSRILCKYSQVHYLEIHKVILHKGSTVTIPL